MALKLNERYPGRFNNPTTSYPQGSFKNRTAPSAQDGSYLEQDWANDILGFFGRLIAVSGVILNGNVDTALSSQYYDALRALTLQRTNPFGDIASDGSTALSTARTNLGLGAAARLPSPTFTTGTGYTLFKSPFFDGATVRWFATLSMNVTPPALTNNQTFSVAFPVAFSSDVKAVLSSAIGELTTTAVIQDLGCGIQSLSTTGMVILSAWGARAVSDGDFQFIVTGVMNA